MGVNAVQRLAGRVDREARVHSERRRGGEPKTHRCACARGDVRGHGRARFTGALTQKKHEYASGSQIRFRNDSNHDVFRNGTSVAGGFDEGSGGRRTIAPAAYAPIKTVRSSVGATAPTASSEEREALSRASRCGSIVDRYTVPCRESAYEVYADMYLCTESAAAGW